MERVSRGIPRQQAGGSVSHLRAERVACLGDREDGRKEDAAEALLVVGPGVRCRSQYVPAPRYLDSGGGEVGSDEVCARAYCVCLDMSSVWVTSFCVVLSYH